MKEPFVNKRSLEIDIICLRNRWNSTLSATDATVVKTFYPNIWNNNLLTKVVLQSIIWVMEASKQHFSTTLFCRSVTFVIKTCWTTLWTPPLLVTRIYVLSKQLERRFVNHRFLQTIQCVNKAFGKHCDNHRFLKTGPTCLILEHLQQRFVDHCFLETNPTCYRHIWNNPLSTSVFWKLHICVINTFGTFGIAFP